MFSGHASAVARLSFIHSLTCDASRLVVNIWGSTMFATSLATFGSIGIMLCM